MSKISGDEMDKSSKNYPAKADRRGILHRQLVS